MAADKAAPLKAAPLKAAEEEKGWNIPAGTPAGRACRASRASSSSSNSGRDFDSGWPGVRDKLGTRLIIVWTPSQPAFSFTASYRLDFWAIFSARKPLVGMDRVHPVKLVH